MSSTLSKRFPRELKNNLGKYLGMFLLLVVAISMTTGFLASAASIEKILNNVRDNYLVEDGNFTTNFPLRSSVRAEVENLGLTLYENYSYDLVSDVSQASGTPNAAKPASATDNGATIRVFQTRTDCNISAVAEGAKPQRENEIALDRVFAQNNGIQLGDVITVAGTDMTVVGIITLPDYQALFERNSDFIFNAITFCVAEVSPETFASFTGSESYTYSFMLNDRTASDKERTDLEKDIADVLSDRNVALSNMIDCDANQGIGYALDDVIGDQLGWKVLLILLIIIMAFVFVILSNSTIDAESAVIGTLLASGWNKRELILHYLTLPSAVGIVAGLCGNILGYTVIATPMRNLYYNSYSIPPFEFSFSWEVFTVTTVVPLVLLVGITAIGLARKMNCTPLQFLRHDIERHNRRGSIKLPERLSFERRFRLRLFVRNLPNFATLFLGISFASLLLIFGLCMLPVVNGYANDLAESLASKHFYTLKAPLELEGTEEEREAYRAAGELADTIDTSAIDEDAVSDALENLLRTRVEDRMSDFFENNLNTTALAQQIMRQGGSGYIAGIAVSDLMQAASSGTPDTSNIDADDVDFGELYRLGILYSTEIDLTDCGLGVVDLATFSKDSINADDLLFDALDFSNISAEELGLGGVDMGGLSLNEFFTLLQKTTNLDDDAHPINTLANDEDALAQAEKVAVGSLDVPRAFGGEMETARVYGIQENSRYWDADVSNGKIVVGAGLLEKCNLTLGTQATFSNSYTGKTYELVPSAAYGKATDTNVYMSIETYNELFDEKVDYFNAWASDSELAIDERYLVNDLTADEMAKIGDQMEDSMSSIMNMITWVALIIFVILIYLLTKTIIDRSARAISYMKVFGYRDGEINQLYLRAITTTVAISLVACLPLILWVIIFLVKIVFMGYPGNFVITIDPLVYVKEIALGLVCYAVVALLHMRRIKKVPLALALKVQE